jgi:tetratricopeptide (TPR) repeat protein
MADVGVKKPGLKVPSYFHGMQNYRDPLKMYTDLLAKFPPGDIAEKLLFQKGYVLHKSGRYKESFDTYNPLLRQFPQGKYKGEAIKYFLTTTDRLVYESSIKGGYPAVTDTYFRSREHGLITGDNFTMAYSMGESLRRDRKI